MTTIQSPPPARTDTRPMRDAPTRRLSPTQLRVAGACTAVLLAVFALFTAMPWPADGDAYLGDDIAAVAYTASLAIVIGIALRGGAFGVRTAWRTVGIISFAVLLGTTAFLAVGPLMPATSLERAEQFLSPLTLGVFWLAAVGILTVGRWRGPARALPFLTASWPMTVVGVVLVAGELGSTAWLAFVIHLGVYQALTALALIIDARRLAAAS
ncbi:hypothetical protein LQ757_10315 [Agromyces sp. SYSU K20354]|uniref:hypothetical protein n=1 Tax=Agromyces cavernae TaxID=2898659 RepID=UPI001E474F2C|nr:hypothetical protein [Agromyces cavernae]MCD2442665.1 hypothetical protein [Agromyces cavernae]